MVLKLLEAVSERSERSHRNATRSPGSGVGRAAEYRASGMDPGERSEASVERRGRTTAEG